jgi:hypothetical protein
VQQRRSTPFAHQAVGSCECAGVAVKENQKTLCITKEDERVNCCFLKSIPVVKIPFELLKSFQEIQAFSRLILSTGPWANRISS